jgi:RNA polymerase sigma-70 factor (ECF subfamily)
VTNLTTSHLIELSRPEPSVSAVTTDAELVARAKRDPAVFADLYLRYVDRVYRYCYRRLGGPDAAADATSQVFAKALAALPSCRDETFRAWLYAIAHNVLVDSHRGRSLTAPLESAVDLADPAPSPEERAVTGAAWAEVVAVLDRLSPDQRQVVELRLAGLSGNEIGEVLGRRRDAIDAIQSRAVARLRTLLGVTREGDGHDGTR